MKKLLLILILLFIPTAHAFGVQLMESYNVNDDDNNGVLTTQQLAQTFTSTSTGAYTIYSVKLKLVKDNGTGNFTITIKNTDGAGKPTSTALCAGSITEASIATVTPDWYEIVLTDSIADGCTVATSTKYAIVATVDAGRINWYDDSAGALYAGGNWLSSADSGATWTPNTNADDMFEVWGTFVAGGETTTAGIMTFPEIMLILLAVFILCFIIEKGGNKVIDLVKGIYAYKM